MPCFYSAVPAKHDIRRKRLNPVSVISEIKKKIKKLFSPLNVKKEEEFLFITYSGYALAGLSAPL